MPKRRKQPSLPPSPPEWIDFAHEPACPAYNKEVCQ